MRLVLLSIPVALGALGAWVWRDPDPRRIQPVPVRIAAPPPLEFARPLPVPLDPTAAGPAERCVVLADLNVRLIVDRFRLNRRTQYFELLANHDPTHGNIRDSRRQHSLMAQELRAMVGLGARIRRLESEKALYERSTMKREIIERLTPEGQELVRKLGVACDDQLGLLVLEQLELCAHDRSLLEGLSIQEPDGPSVEDLHDLCGVEPEDAPEEGD